MTHVTVLFTLCLLDSAILHVHILIIIKYIDNNSNRFEIHGEEYGVIHMPAYKTRFSPSNDSCIH